MVLASPDLACRNKSHKALKLYKLIHVLGPQLFSEFRWKGFGGRSGTSLAPAKVHANQLGLFLITCHCFIDWSGIQQYSKTETSLDSQLAAQSAETLMDHPFVFWQGLSVYCLCSQSYNKTKLCHSP